MKTFSELLNLYIQNTGISDSELARSVGVSRQTIFRWKEGLTTRPNSRDDIIAIAKKLRLSPEEKNDLLLSAGFRPEENIASTEPVAPEIQPEKEDSDARESEAAPPVDAPMQQPAAHARKKKLSSRLAFSTAIIIVVLLCAWAVRQNWSIWFPDTGTPDTPATTSPAENTPTTIVPAAPGELLILVAPLSNSDSAITAQLAGAIERESRNNRITAIEVEQLPGPVTGEKEAAEIIKDTGAQMVIYGNTGNSGIDIYLSPAPFPAFTSTSFDKSDLTTEEVRALSLLVLGSLYVNRNEKDFAYTLLSAARNILTDNESTSTSLVSTVEKLLEETEQ